MTKPFDGAQQAYEDAQTRLANMAIARDRIVSLDTDALWAIVRSTSPMTKLFANELTWAKAELRRRGADTVGF